MANWYDCSRCGKHYKEADNPHECADVIALRAENAALREALEWACEDMRQNDVIPYDTKKRLIGELRRRAGKEG